MHAFGTLITHPSIWYCFLSLPLLVCTGEQVCVTIHYQTDKMNSLLNNTTNNNFKSSLKNSISTKTSNLRGSLRGSGVIDEHDPDMPSDHPLSQGQCCSGICHRTSSWWRVYVAAKGNDTHVDEAALMVEIKYGGPGAGFDKKKRKQINREVFSFNPNELQGGGGTGGGTGSGLAMSLAKTIVEAHGGALKIRSDGAGQGAVFVMTLPRSHTHVENPSSAAAASINVPLIPEPPEDLEAVSVSAGDASPFIVASPKHLSPSVIMSPPVYDSPYNSSVQNRIRDVNVMSRSSMNDAHNLPKLSRSSTADVNSLPIDQKVLEAILSKLSTKDHHEMEDDSTKKMSTAMEETQPVSVPVVIGEMKGDDGAHVVQISSSLTSSQRRDDIPIAAFNMPSDRPSTDNSIKTFVSLPSSPVASHKVILPKMISSPTTTTKDNQSSSLAGLHVLVVEDSAVARTMLVKLLKTMKCTTEEAEDGIQAVAMVTSSRLGYVEPTGDDGTLPIVPPKIQRPFDLILCDSVMPNMVRIIYYYMFIVVGLLVVS